MILSREGETNNSKTPNVMGDADKEGLDYLTHDLQHSDSHSSGIFSQVKYTVCNNMMYVPFWVYSSLSSYPLFVNNISKINLLFGSIIALSIGSRIITLHDTCFSGKKTNFVKY